MPRRISYKLTDVQIKNAKPKDKPYKLTDGDGLYLMINPSGGKLWRVKYYFEGVEKLLSLGPYPALSIAEARKRLTEAKALLVQNIDPSENKKAVKAARSVANTNSYEVVAREWISKRAESWKENHRLKILARQENNIFPFLGSKPISSITAPELLTVLRRIEQRGALETAHRTLEECSRIFRYAIATHRAERDPAADLRGEALPPAKSKNFASITKPKEVGALLRAIDGYEGNVVVAYALRLAPLVFVRPGELRHAQWKEFELDDPLWRIPAERMKMNAVHIVPLARQVTQLLAELRRYTGQSEYLFPSIRGEKRPISDVTLLAALRRMGYTKEQMTVHGFRSMASTLLNELGYNRDWIERQLAHSERNNIRAAYNYAEYLQERRRMMQEWADYLDSLRNS